MKSNKYLLLIIVMMIMLSTLNDSTLVEGLTSKTNQRSVIRTNELIQTKYNDSRMSQLTKVKTATSNNVNNGFSHKVHRFFHKYSMIWGIVLVIIGFFVGFYGHEMMNILLFLVGFIVAFLGGIWAIDAIIESTKSDVSDSTGAGIIAGLALLGIVVGICSLKMVKFGLFLLALWAGTCLGFLVATAFLVKNQVAFWGIVAGFAILVSTLAGYVKETVIIICSSFLGAYAIVRGISFYAGGFPDEKSIHEQLSSGKVHWQNFNKVFYVYLGCILILGAAISTYHFNHKTESYRQYQHYTRWK